MTRVLSYAVLLVVFVVAKILASQFFGAYGLYIFVAVALVVLILILWRSFRRDTSEGVGINLH
jgi:positive regulator of sigma E activity